MNRNSGFTASASVLKLVSTIQKMGKKNISPTIQARSGQNILPNLVVWADDDMQPLKKRRVSFKDESSIDTPSSISDPSEKTTSGSSDDFDGPVDESRVRVVKQILSSLRGSQGALDDDDDDDDDDNDDTKLKLETLLLELDAHTKTTSLPRFRKGEVDVILKELEKANKLMFRAGVIHLI